MVTSLVRSVDVSGPNALWMLATPGSFVQRKWWAISSCRMLLTMSTWAVARRLTLSVFRGPAIRVRPRRGRSTRGTVHAFSRRIRLHSHVHCEVRAASVSSLSDAAVLGGNSSKVTGAQKPSAQRRPWPILITLAGASGGKHASGIHQAPHATACGSRFRNVKLRNPGNGRQPCRAQRSCLARPPDEQRHRLGCRKCLAVRFRHSEGCRPRD